jgi:hypothetical protein
MFIICVRKNLMFFYISFKYFELELQRRQLHNTKFTASINKPHNNKLLYVTACHDVITIKHKAISDKYYDDIYTFNDPSGRAV